MLELMLAVAIGGVLLATAVPSFKSSIQSQRVRAAASDLHLSLMLARSESLKRNRNIDVTAPVSWTAGWNVTVAGTSTLLRDNDAHDDVAVECSTDTDAAAEPCPGTITFGRAGRPTSYIEFRVFHASNANIPARCVSITPSGRARVVMDKDGDPSNGCD